MSGRVSTPRKDEIKTNQCADNFEIPGHDYSLWFDVRLMKNILAMVAVLASYKGIAKE